jgi:hypothetical protein
MWMAEALWAHRHTPFGWIERALPKGERDAASDGGAWHPTTYFESPLDGQTQWMHPVQRRLRAAARAQLADQQSRAAASSARRLSAVQQRRFSFVNTGMTMALRRPSEALSSRSSSPSTDRQSPVLL